MSTPRSSVIALLSAFVLTGCSTTTSLAPELATAIARSADAGFRIADVESAEGAHFLIACPYESRDSIESRLGFGWADAPDYSRIDDKQSIIVVKDDDTVTSHTELARDVVDFCSYGQWKLLPTDSNLTVTRSADSLVVSVR